MAGSYEIQIDTVFYQDIRGTKPRGNSNWKFRFFTLYGVERLLGEYKAPGGTSFSKAKGYATKAAEELNREVLIEVWPKPY